MEHFWFKPKPYHFQKENHCLRNTYDIKNMQLYHNIVKKQGEYHFGGFSNHNLFLYGPQTTPPFLPLPKKIILLTLFLI